jgi:hypothetical protein
MRIFLLFLLPILISSLFAGHPLDPIPFKKRSSSEGKLLPTDKMTYNSEHQFNGKQYNGKLFDTKKVYFQDKEYRGKEFHGGDKDYRLTEGTKEFKMIEHKDFSKNGEMARIGEKGKRDYKEAPISRNKVLARIDELSQKYNQKPNQSSLREINKDVPLLIRSDEEGFPVTKAGAEAHE